MSHILPDVCPVDFAALRNPKKRMLILAEGFEERSNSFISGCSEVSFDKIVVCRYVPEKESKYTILKSIIKESHKASSVSELVFNRYNPFEFENALSILFSDMGLYDEIVLDISVMSKYMIIQIMCSLAAYNNNLIVIYTEPESYAPSEKEFETNIVGSGQDAAALLPSCGVHDIVRTPLLTSLVMQKSPAILVSFLSFNEQLIRALLSEFNPVHLFLINGVPPELSWREKAMAIIHKRILTEYQSDNPVDENGLPKRKSSTLWYKETFNILSDIYKTYCVTNRIVVSPTGSKMQAVGTSLIKMCCQDIHIEYPTPESYFVSGYSSSNIKTIHQVLFLGFKHVLKAVVADYKLNQ